jgi:hypothetical protein
MNIVEFGRSGDNELQERKRSRVHAKIVDTNGEGIA